MALVFVVSLVGGTCFLILGHLFAGLSGRFWIFVATLLFYLLGIPNLLVLDSWLRYNHPEVYGAYHDRLTLLAGIAVALKLLAAAGVSVVVCRRRLAGARFIAVIAGTWLAVAASLHTVLHQLFLDSVPSEYLLAFVAALLLPLTRIVATPLAVEYNRRR